MYKKKISHLLHSMTSFVLMLIVSRLTSILLNGVIGDTCLETLIPFLLATAVAAICFKVMPQDISGTADDDEDKVEPIVKRNAAYSSLHLIFTIAAMTGIMYIINFITEAAMFSGISHTGAIELTPLYFISLVLIHPIIEEYLFRNLLYGELRQLSPIFACFVQAIMFALSHNTVSGMFYALICGITLALLVENTGHYLCAIIAHAAINLRSLLFSTVLENYEVLRSRIDLIIMLIGGIALLLILFIHDEKSSEKSEGESNDPSQEQSDS